VANLRESLRMAAWLGDKIAADTRLELAAPVTMGLVCCRVRRGDSATRELMRRINGSRDFFVSQTALDGKVVMRVAIGNIRTRQQDIEELWSSILDILDEIEANCRRTGPSGAGHRSPRCSPMDQMEWTAKRDKLT
jgi:aromatic-L-amino-acid decarboxylase